jgi:hypothetical protein
MRYLLALLLAVPVLAQEPAIDETREWIGVMEWRDERGPDGVALVPTLVTLRRSGNTLTGSFKGVRPTQPTGLIEGTVTATNEIEATVTLYAGAEVEGVTISPERCEGVGRFKGYLFNGVMRLTADRVRADDPIKRLRDRNCTNLPRVVWTLQRH